MNPDDALQSILSAIQSSKDKHVQNMVDAIDNIQVGEDATNTNISTPKFYNTDLLDPDTARRVRMLQVVSKFASTLTLRPIRVDMGGKMAQGTPDAPAWSDSDNIWFHENSLQDLTSPDTVLNIKGLSLHEIAHILLTPRAGSNLAKDVQKQGLWRAFNALEDQRIEMYMTKRFGNVADWLKAAVAKFIMDEPEQWNVAFPLLHGRKYLPKELRKQVADLYEQPQHVQEIGSLIDQYIVLNLADPKNYAVALDIIQKYDALITQLPSTSTDYWNNNSWNNNSGWKRVSDPSGHDHRATGEWKASKSKPMSKAEQQKVSERVADAIEQDNATSADTNGNEGAQDGTPDSMGSGSATGDKSLSDIAKDIINTVKQSKAREIAQTIKQYNADAELTSTNAGKPSRLDTFDEVVPKEIAQASKSFATELERLRAEFDPGWLRRTEHGRLNIQRYVTGTDLDECFDEWDIGREDAVDIEAVILLDISGSMQGMAKGAFESMWAMKRALDRANASTTVLAYDHRPFVLYSSEERVSTNVRMSWCRGGTEPLQTLKYAKNVLAESKRAIKLCITITDGVWSDSEASDKLLKEFRRAGVLTALAFVSDPRETYHNDDTPVDTHGCEVAVHITDTNDLFALGRGIVNLGIKRNLINAGV